MTTNKYIEKIILVGLIIILYISEPTIIETRDINFFYFIIILITLIVHIIGRNNKNWFSVDILFLLGFLVVHLQWSVMIGLSEVTPRIFSRAYANVQYIAYGTWLSTIGLTSWVLGYSLIRSKPILNTTFFIKYKKLLIFTITVYILFLLFAGADYLKGNIYKGQSESASAEGVGRYFQVFFSISIILLTTTVFLNKECLIKSHRFKLLKANKWYLLILISSLLLFLSIGDRGGAIQIVISFLVLFGVFVRPITPKELLVFALLGSLVLTVIGFGRGSSSEDKNILTAGVENFELDSAYDLSIELANSSRTLYSAISYVENNDFFYGKLWLGDIFSIFPLGKNIFIALTEEKNHELDSAEFITYLAYGKNAISGEGTSLIADIYLNFGKHGVVFFMFFYGILIKKMTNSLNVKCNLYWILAAAIFSSFSLYLSRGSILFPIKPIVWGIIIFYVLTTNLNSRRSD